MYHHIIYRSVSHLFDPIEQRTAQLGSGGQHTQYFTRLAACHLSSAKSGHLSIWWVHDLIFDTPCPFDTSDMILSSYLFGFHLQCPRCVRSIDHSSSNKISLRMPWLFIFSGIHPSLYSCRVFPACCWPHVSIIHGIFAGQQHSPRQLFIYAVYLG